MVLLERSLKVTIYNHFYNFLVSVVVFEILAKFISEDGFPSKTENSSDEKFVLLFRRFDGKVGR